MGKQIVYNLYNPSEFSKDEIKQLFVIRKKSFERVFEKIKEPIDKPQPHVLIVGERGTGKTMLLLRLLYGIEDDVDLNKTVFSIRLPEEQKPITRLFKLWERLAYHLESKYIEFKGICASIDDFYENYKQSDWEEALDSFAYNAVFNLVKQHNRKIVFFIDNFANMLTVFKEQERQRLRGIMQHNSHFQIIAASAVVTKDIDLYKNELYELFERIYLKSPKNSEIDILLRNLGSFYKKESQINYILKNEPIRIQILSQLSGGNVRILHFLFDLLVSENTGNVIQDFYFLLDRNNDFYTKRVEDFTGERAEIIDVLALNWDAMGAGDIGKKIRMESNAVSVKLRQMKEDDIIEQELINAKNKIYRLKDRFFNIWYLMRYGNHNDEKRANWLVQFFKEWFSHYQQNEKALNTVRQSLKGELDPHIKRVLKTVFEKLENLTFYAQKQIEKTLTIEDDSSEKIIKSYSIDDLLTAYKTVKNTVEFDIELLYHCPIALHLKKRILEKLPELSLEKIEGVKQYLAKEQERIEVLAVQEYSKNYTLSAPNLNDISVGDWLYEGEDFELASVYYKKLNDKDEAKKYLPEKYRNLANQYLKENTNKDVLKAENYYYQAVYCGDAESALALGKLYQYEPEFKKNYKKALENYLIAYNRGLKTYEVCVEIGFCYYELKDAEKSIKYFEEAINNNPKNPNLYRLLGNVYSYLSNDLHKAEEVYKIAIDKFQDKDTMNSLAWMYFERGIKKEEAFSYAQKSCERIYELNSEHTLACIELWNNQIEMSLERAEKFLFDKILIEDTYDEFILYLLLLLAKKQYTFLDDYFTGEKGVALQTKDRFRPIYFALMHFMKDKYPYEYMKMGPELKLIVEQIMEQAEKMAIKYN